MKHWLSVYDNRVWFKMYRKLVRRNLSEKLEVGHHPSYRELYFKRLILKEKKLKKLYNALAYLYV